MPCLSSTHINNLAGVISWGSGASSRPTRRPRHHHTHHGRSVPTGLRRALEGFVLWITSLRRFRRYNYAVFFNTHQLHLVFFMFGCIHWPTCAPRLVPQLCSRTSRASVTHRKVRCVLTGLCYAAPSIVFYAADLALRAHISRAAVPVVARVRPSASNPCLTTLVIACAPSRTSTACPHSIEVGREGGVCPVKDSQLALMPEADEEWTGGCLYLAVPSLGRLPYLQWHPFSIGGSAGGSSLVVHVQVTNRKRWTSSLAALVTNSAPCRTRTSSAVEEDSGGDQRLRMRVIGPIPAPPALTECVSEARRGVPLLLIGGGSGIVPLVAVVRRLACGLMPSNASVVLVLVVREPACHNTMCRKTASMEAYCGSRGIGWATS